MSYVAINVRQDDLLNGIFVKAGMGFRGGEFVFHMHEEDYRQGALVKGLFKYGELIPYTWNDDSGDYRAQTFPERVVDGVVHAEQYGGTKEQFEAHQREHGEFCKVHGWTQGEIKHLPMADYERNYILIEDM